MYIQYQSILHPDRFTLADQLLQERSNILSSYASNGLNTLTDPILRASYLLNKMSNSEFEIKEEDKE